MLITTLIASTALVAQPTFDLTFDGGTLSQWSKAVKAASSSDNIVLMDADSPIMVPSMSLKDVSLGTCAQVIEGLAAVVAWEVAPDQGASVWVIETQSSRGRRGPRGQANTAVGPVASTSVLRLPAGYRDAESAAALRELLVHVSTMGGGKPPAISVMPDAGIMALCGPSAQVDLCEELVNTIPHKAAGREDQRSATSGREAAHGKLLSRRAVLRAIDTRFDQLGALDQSSVNRHASSEAAN